MTGPFFPSVDPQLLTLRDQHLPARLQPAALVEAIQDAVGSMAAGTPPVTATYNDTLGTLTIALDQAALTEVIQDAVAPELGTPVTDFGADRTGTASSTAAFQAALAAGDVIIPAGTYRVGRVTYTGEASRRIVALGRVTIVQTDPLGVFEMRGVWDALGTVSSYATVTTSLVTPGEAAPVTSDTAVTQLTMASPVTVAVGDVLKIVSDDQVPTGRTASWRMGEHSLAGKATTAGTTVTLSNIIVENYATNIRLARLRYTTFSVTGPITFDTDPAIRETTVFGAVVLMRAAQSCYIGEGVEFHNSVGRAIGNFTYGARIDGVKFRNLANRPSKSQYGYGIQDGGWMTRMSGCWGENLRHLYSEGSADTTAGSANYEYFGGGWYCHISDSVGMNGQGQEFDTHGTAYGTTFADCKVYGSFTGASSGGTGFVSRGRHISFQNCYVENSFRGFGVGAQGTMLRNCVARRCRYSALEIDGDRSDAVTVTSIPGIRVIGGEFETLDGAYQTAIIGQPVGGYALGVEIEDARFRKLGAPGGGARQLDIGPTVELKLYNVTFDWERYTGAHSVIGASVRSATSSIIGRGLRNLGGSSPIAAFVGFAPASADGNATPIDVVDIEHKHSSVNMTPFNANLTAAEGTWRTQFGPASRSASADSTLVAAAGAVLPIANKSDPALTVRLTGTAGAVTLAAIPTTTQTAGQILHVLNASTGAVTIPSLSTIAADATATYVFSQGAWRIVT